MTNNIMYSVLMIEDKLYRIINRRFDKETNSIKGILCKPSVKKTNHYINSGEEIELPYTNIIRIKKIEGAVIK